MFRVETADLDNLLSLLTKLGYKIFGPKVRDSAICYELIEKVSDLPIGITDEQDKAYYKLKPNNTNSLFDYVVGPDSCKKIFNPPVQKIYELDLNEQYINIKPLNIPEEKVAIIGARACEIAALEIQDKIFISSSDPDLNYIKKRKDSLIIAVNCSKSEKNCFCTSMHTGPKATRGFDLAITEIIDKFTHYFLIEVGSETGGKIVNQLNLVQAKAKEIDTAANVLEKTKNNMQKIMNTNNIQQVIYNNYDNSIWDQLENRCLSCGNCTFACPTCFCSNTKEVTDMATNVMTSEREWDSCFNKEFSYTASGVIRETTKSRYRQWISHKLAAWLDQFGTSGCVGCGRCITWCPVKIDITEEVAKLQKNAEY